jgi:hypothetical protein
MAITENGRLITENGIVITENGDGDRWSSQSVIVIRGCVQSRRNWASG